MRSWSDFSQFFFDFQASGTPKKWLKRCSVVPNHTFTTFASKLLGKRLGVDFGFHFGVILVPFSPPGELRKTTKKITNFRSIFFEILAPTWPPRCHQVGQIWGLLVYIFALLRPSLLDMAPGRPPDLPKHPPDPDFLSFFTILGTFFDTFLDTLSSKCARPFFSQICNAASVGQISTQIFPSICAGAVP